MRDQPWGWRTGLAVGGLVLLMGAALAQPDRWQAPVAVPAGGWTVAEAVREVARVTGCRLVLQLSPEAQATHVTGRGTTAREVLDAAVQAAAAVRHEVGRTLVIAAPQPTLAARQRRRLAAETAWGWLPELPATTIEGLRQERLVDVQTLPEPAQLTVGAIFQPGLTTRTWRERLARDGMAVGVVWDPYLEYGAPGHETRLWLRDRWRYVQFGRLQAASAAGLLEPADLGVRQQPADTPNRFALAGRVGPALAAPDRDAAWVAPDEGVFRSGVMQPTSLASLGAVAALRARLAAEQAASLASARPGDNLLVRYEVVQAQDLDSDPLARRRGPRVTAMGSGSPPTSTGPG